MNSRGQCVKYVFQGTSIKYLKDKVYSFDVDTELMLSIAYYRGRLEEYKYSSKLKKIIEKSKDADVIIAPIADNRMFRIIDEFIEGLIADEACCI